MFFFFKQKAADEMRISDWSSDVCSSDLIALLNLAEDLRLAEHLAFQGSGHRQQVAQRILAEVAVALAGQLRRRAAGRRGDELQQLARDALAGARHHEELDARSDEHTSELQSLMRISYAVFCLKKNNTRT